MSVGAGAEETGQWLAPKGNRVWDKAIRALERADGVSHGRTQTSLPPASSQLRREDGERPASDLHSDGNTARSPQTDPNPTRQHGISPAGKERRRTSFWSTGVPVWQRRSRASLHRICRSARMNWAGPSPTCPTNRTDTGPDDPASVNIYSSSSLRAHQRSTLAAANLDGHLRFLLD